MLMAKTWKIKDIEPQRNNKNKDFLYFKLTHPQSAFRLDVHYGQYGLVENCVAYIFTRLCVCCNLQVQMAKIYPNNTFGVEKKKKKEGSRLFLTCARMSFIASLESSSLLPRMRSSLNIRT